MYHKYRSWNRRVRWCHGNGNLFTTVWQTFSKNKVSSFQEYHQYETMPKNWPISIHANWH